MRRIYLDYAAATPLDPAVRTAMRPYEREKFGNPSSLHRFGQEASAAVFAARRKVSGAIGADPGCIIFTASATEANNLAIKGVVNGYRKFTGSRVQGLGFRKGEARKEKSLSPKPYPLNLRIVVAATEHESVLEPVRELAARGAEVVSVPVSREGIIDVGALRKAIDRRTAIVSVGNVNSETGAIQPIAEIAKIIRDFRSALNPSGYAPYPIFHTDAVQALPYLDCAVNIIGADLVTLSSHKIYGPKGAAALYVRRDAAKRKAQSAGAKERFAVNDLLLAPLITGGNQEMGFRAGTENVPAIVGFGEAAAIAARERGSDARHARRMRNRFLAELKSFWRGVELNGPPPGLTRTPGNLNVYLPGISAAELLVRLDLGGVAASAGSACAARTPVPSHVLRAMGLGADRAKGSIRFTVGRETTEREISGAIKVLKNIYQKL